MPDQKKAHLFSHFSRTFFRTFHTLVKNGIVSQKWPALVSNFHFRIEYSPKYLYSTLCLLFISLNSGCCCFCPESTRGLYKWSTSKPTAVPLISSCDLKSMMFFMPRCSSFSSCWWLKISGFEPLYSFVRVIFLKFLYSIVDMQQKFQLFFLFWFVATETNTRCHWMMLDKRITN